jgi:branched-chain amino acid transport system permease protein
MAGLGALADAALAALVFATLATAWSWLGAYAGVFSLGNALFFGIGGYAVAVSNLRGGSPWYGALGGALFAVIIAAVCGLLTLRGRGYTFSAVTLLLGAAAEPYVASHAWLGPGNIFAFPVRLGFLNLQFAQPWPYLLLALVVYAVAQGLTFALRASQPGFYLRALRTNPAAARGVGVRALPPRLIVLTAMAFVTSVAGSLFAEYARGVTPPSMFALGLSFDIALIGAIAGTASSFGPALAGLVYAIVAKFVPLHPPGAAGVAVLAVEFAAIVALTLLRLPGGSRARRQPTPPAVARTAR